MVDTITSVSTRPQAKIAPKLDDADRTKEREFYRYWPQRPKGEDSSRQPSPPSTVVTYSSSSDKALTAFAQLGALRLNTRRCLISFFDRRNCYILAEATKTMSLHTGQAEFSDDTLCWGTSIFPKEKSICYYTVKLPFQYSAPTLDDYLNVPSLVVNDLSQDDRFKAYPFVVNAPYSRFYAGVPIRSPNGHSIGTYCVLDDTPREGLSSFELDFLKDMAVIVMRHLEMSRATDDHKRGGIMVKSLGFFADGRSLDEWLDPWETDLASPPLPSDQTVPQHQRRSTMTTATSPQTYLLGPVPLHRNNSASSGVSSIQSANPMSPFTAIPGSAEITPASEIVGNTNVEVTRKTASSTKSDEKNMVSPEVKLIFNRAAHMIVEATEAEGAVFFDAKVSTWGGLVDDDILSEQPQEPEKSCAILGAARYKHPHNSLPLSDHYSMSENVLKHLLRNYAHGQIFNLDDEAVTAVPFSDASADGSDVEGSPKSDSSRISDDENLLRDIFPQARSLVLYPLWDTHRDRWFASVIIWSTDPMRVFTSEQELSYLAAFSNSAMAEVARLDTKLADAAKADFISSISHELRSPLHGILGMTDLLKETRLDSQQSSHAQTIETCGKTLLDTINHVLDFAKINNLTRGTSKRNKKHAKKAKHIISPGQGHTNDIMTIISDVDMSTLVEEALESVFAGFHFQQSAAQSLEQRSSKLDPPPIAVVVDINKSDSYVFRTQPGAWRRVIMNLFGNALKYTPAGYIKFKLQAISKIDSNEESAELRLTLTDSGIGMSEDYINNRLFHSFAQENPLSQGTGLGLSIVKQLVELLGGDVEVRSEKGRGTKFIVSCHMRPSTLSPTVGALTPELTLLNISKRTTGMNVHFVGFDEEEEDYFPVNSLKNKNATKMTKKALENQCLDWFGMRVWKHGDETASAPDIFMATESGARYLRAQYSQRLDRSLPAPIVVVCRGAASAQWTTAITVPGLVFECIAQPCGPHKMAKALSSCLDRHANRLMVQSTDTDTTITRVSQLSLKENSAPINAGTMDAQMELHRPTIASTMSAPVLRSVNSSPVRTSIEPHRSLNCLAVDDNPINLRLLRTFVEKLGHRHVLAKTGLEALNAYKDACATTHATSSTTSLPSSTINLYEKPPSQVDVILMDINMPEMDGLEATRQIRAHERDIGLSPVTIIALTGVASTEAQQEAHASGVNLFVIKPVRLADLEVILKGVVTRNEGGGKQEKKKGNDVQLAHMSADGGDGLVDEDRTTSVVEGDAISKSTI